MRVFKRVLWRQDVPLVVEVRVRTPSAVRPGLRVRAVLARDGGCREASAPQRKCLEESGPDAGAGPAGRLLRAIWSARVASGPGTRSGVRQPESTNCRTKGMLLSSCDGSLGWSGRPLFCGHALRQPNRRLTASCLHGLLNSRPERETTVAASHSCRGETTNRNPTSPPRGVLRL